MHGVRFGYLRSQGIGPAGPILPYAPETPFLFDTDLSSTHG
jgi:hypothetical protein